MFIPGFPLDSYFDLSFSYVRRLTEHVLLCTGSTRAVQSLFKIVYNEKYCELVVLYSLGVWRRVCLRGKHFSLVNLD